MKRNFTSTVAGASILITAVGLIGKGLGLVREIVFANFFGLNAQYDLYLVGAVLPLTINSIILYLSQNYFIPNYNRIKINEPDNSKRFTNSTFWLFSILSIVFSLVLFSLSKFIIKFYLQPSSYSTFESTLEVFRIFLITIPLNTSFSVLAAYLQAEYEFKLPAYSQLFLNVSIIFIVIIFSTKTGIYTIPYGYVIGSLLQLIFLLIKVKDRIKLNLFEFIKSKNSFSIINYSLVITILIESISQIYLLADRYFFDSVPQGGIAALNYASNIFLLPITIISVALSTAIFPKLSHSISSNNKEDLENKLSSFYSINLYLFVPISLILFFYGDLIIRILFQRGEFNFSATIMTFDVLKFYALSLIFYSTYAVINKLIYSANLVRHLLIITIVGSIIKVILNFALVGKYQQAGLAISSVISYVFFFLCGTILISHNLKLKIKKFFSEFLFNIVNGMLSYLICGILVNNYISKNYFINSFFKLILFIIIYVANSIIINQNAVNLFRNVIFNRRSKEVKAI
ncbi:MAG: oligosaccharide flippase family protein [Bacteroidetes bacterium]|nr:oligosaccharide flippase family protein [Bacteroidota bacterium]